jgi:NADH-quinone oxidoreductase subunit L
MEAPTPASAFIHSSTLVIAGVYLLLQFHAAWFNITPIRDIFLLVSCFSVSFAALLACMQNDIKRLIAFSTISQVAYLYVSVCLFNSTAAIFYL